MHLVPLWAKRGGGFGLTGIGWLFAFALAFAQTELLACAQTSGGRQLVDRGRYFSRCTG